MIFQDWVEAHADRIDSLVDAFGLQVSRAVDLIEEGVTDYLHENLSVDSSGSVEQTSANARALSGLPTFVQSLLVTSGFFAAVSALSLSFSEQVDEFLDAYGHMQASVSGLPGVTVTADQADVLANQAMLSVTAMEATATDMVSNLQKSTTTLLSNVSVGDLVSFVIDIVRGLTRVVPKAKELLTLFFRIIGNLIFSALEASGTILSYDYVGPLDEKTREFCANLLSQGHPFTRSEIDSLDNGQIPGVFTNCGGYGCRHWWSIAYVVREAG